MTAIRTGRPGAPRRRGRSAWVWLIVAILAAAGVGVFWWARSRAQAPGSQQTTLPAVEFSAPSAGTVPDYRSADLFALTEKERRRVLLPAKDNPEPKQIFIDGRLTICMCYSEPNDEGWTAAWQVTPRKMGDTMTFSGGFASARMKAMKDEWFEPGPGATILYGQPDGHKSFVFGTVTLTIGVPPERGGGGTSTVTVHDDAFHKATFQILQLNPNRHTP